MRDSIKKWIAALRSGEFEQGQGVLNNNGKCCCLGVACEIYQREIGDLKVEDGLDGIRIYDENHASLSTKVQDWLGINNGTGCLNSPIERYRTLVELNDKAGYTFDQIADVIENGGLLLETP